ncbi:helix-turn-helix domain-containing protein [Sutcliffiella horikoshii]|uniref:helix-turn-helix domain-containing protein n=1 Tax=Sutcliffiella horikoshii TaxID=79883 RepID=UPI003CF5579F
MNEILNKPVLNVEDIQKYLEIGRRQSYELCNSGAFRVLRIGQRIKVPTQSFLEWVNGNN